MELIIYLISVLGLTDIIVNQEIAKKPRKFINKYFHYSKLNKLFNNKFLTELVSCEVCTGFWVGLGLSFAFTLPFHFLVGGLIGSAINKIVGHLLYKF